MTKETLDTLNPTRRHNSPRQLPITIDTSVAPQLTPPPHSHHRTHKEPNNDNKPLTTQRSTTTVHPNDRTLSTHNESELMDKTPTNLRIYFQNINGIKLDKHGGNWPMVCDVAQTLQVDVMGLAEINVDTTKHHVREQLHTATRKYFKYYKLQTAHTKIRAATNYKPGGIAQLILGMAGTKMGEAKNDRLGRWCSTELRGKNKECLTIYTIYQPGSSLPHPGKFRIIDQQHAEISLETIQGCYKTPRRKFQEDFQKEISAKLAQDHELLIIGDWNESINELQSWVRKFATTNGLIDLCTTNPLEQPKTYKRGHRRIDFALSTNKVKQHCKQTFYAPFDYYLASDHRAIIIDIELSKIIGQQNSILKTPQQREFDTGNPTTITKYVTAKYNELLNHNFIKRMEDIEAASATVSAIEKLDRDMVRASIYAAKQCSSRKKEPWNPKLSKAWALMTLYQTVVSAFKTNRPMPNSLQTLRRKYNLVNPNPTSLQDAETLLKEARKSLQQERRKASEQRRRFLLERAQFYANAKDPSGEKALRRMAAAEETKQVYKKFASARGKTKSVGLTSIAIPKDHIDPTQATEWETIDDPNEVESRLLLRNKLHFGQAQGTPFTVNSLVSVIGEDATGVATQEILEGTFQTASVTPALATILEYMKKSTSTDIAEEKLTTKEFIDKLKTWPEKTTTSPSGLHLSHYHALTRPHDATEGTKQYEAVENARKAIIKLHLSIINACIANRYPLLRWCNAVNIMLEKIPGDPKIHRLRVIHIFEADYNMILGVKWRKALHLAEDEKVLYDGMYGSRPGRSATEPKLLEVLQNEIYRASFKKGINLDLDATSCYDRIIPNVAAICSRKHGITENLTILHTKVLLKTKYRLQTAQGISTASYSHSQETPIYGTGQGAQNSPTIWNFVSSTLCHALEDSTNGATFESWDKTTKVRLGMVGFVDDKSQRANCFTRDEQPSDSELALIMSSDATTWSDYLWISGGKLELTKCSFYIMKPTLSQSSEPYLDHQYTAKLQVKDPETGQPIEIRPISPYHSHKTLGAFINGAGKMATQLTALQQKCNEHLLALRRIPTTRAETWRYYFAIFLPSITYTLPITSLTEKQCQEIQTPIMKVFTRRCGFRSSMNLAIRYGSPRLGGAGFRPLFQEQGVLALELFISNLRSDTQPSKMLRIALSWWQAYCGVSWPILQLTRKPLPQMQRGWVYSLRYFLGQIDGSLEISNITTDTTSDYIMDCVDLQLFSPSEVRKINHCRLFLQIWKIHELDRRSCSMAPPDSCPHDSNYHKFNIPRPTPYAWKIWRRFVFSDSLEHKLAHNIRWTPTLPLDILSQSIVTFTHHDFQDLLHNNPTLVVSDGSVAGLQMTFGWVLATTSGIILAKGRGTGLGGHPTSFRAEGLGTLSALKWLKTRYEAATDTILQIEKIYTDNQGLIQTIQKMRQQKWAPTRSTLQPDWDVTSAITREIQNVAPHTPMEWVEGHQDTSQPLEQLDLPARLNVLADKLASEQHDSPNNPSSPTGTRLECNPCQLTIGSRVISSHYAQEARHAFSAIPITRYTQQKFGWSNETFQSVDWQEFQRLTRSFYQHRITLVKHIWRLAPTGKIASQNDPAIPSTCPHCLAEDECNDHLLKCTSDIRQSWRDKLYTKIKETANNTPYPDVTATQTLLGGLRQWLEDTPFNTATLPELYQRIFLSQTQIGWDNLLRGRFTKEWRQITPVSENKSWTSAIGKTIFTLWLELWKFRNESIYGDTEEKKQEIRKQKAHEQLRELYRYRAKVSLTERNLFHSSLDRHLLKHPQVSAIENWIVTHGRLIQQSALKAQKNGDKHQTTITDFLIG